TIASTPTPSAIIWSAIVAMLFLSPSAFWITHSIPASSHAAWMYGRSNASHRADDAESGKMNPAFLDAGVEPPVSGAPSVGGAGVTTVSDPEPAPGESS